LSYGNYPVSFSLELNVHKATEDLRRLQTVLYRTLDIAQRLGDPNLNRLIRLIQRVITLVNALRLAYKALHLAKMAAGDPLAWAMAGVSVAEFALLLGETVAREAYGSESPQ